MDNKINKAIADETRFKLFERIGKGEICACELPKFVGTSQPAVSQHLKVLFQADLVKMRKNGVKRLYSISKKGKMVLADISRW